MNKSDKLLKLPIKIILLFCLPIYILAIPCVYAKNEEIPKKTMSLKFPKRQINKKYLSGNRQAAGLLKKEYEFIFFYEPDCSYCIEFIPILKEYSQATGIKIIPFSFGDSRSISPLFIDSIPVDQSTIDQFFGKGAKIATPTLFIWNKINGYVYPVASGMHTYQELKMRMEQLIPKMLKKERERITKAALIKINGIYATKDVY